MLISRTLKGFLDIRLLISRIFKGSLVIRLLISRPFKDSLDTKLPLLPRMATPTTPRQTWTGSSPASRAPSLLSECHARSSTTLSGVRWSRGRWTRDWTCSPARATSTPPWTTTTSGISRLRAVSLSLTVKSFIFWYNSYIEKFSLCNIDNRNTLLFHLIVPLLL